MSKELLNHNIKSFASLFFLGLVWTVFSFSIATAQSIFSTVGFGELKYFNSGRSEGMGGIGTALEDQIGYNRFNPSLAAFLSRTTINSGYIFEGVKVRQPVNQFFNHLSRWSGGAFSIRIKDGLVISIGLNQVSDYKFDFQIPIKESLYQTRIQGNGGVSSGHISFACKISKNFALGISFLRYFIRLEETSSIRFNNPDFTDSEDLISTILFGNTVSFGMFYRLNKKLSLGSYLIFPSDLTGRIESRPIYLSNPIVRDASATIPYFIGLGSVYAFSEEIFTGMDLTLFKGSKVKLDGKCPPYIMDATKLSFGGEWTPEKDLTANYIKRINYRMGFSYLRPYIKDTDNSSLNSYSFSLGFGFPFNYGRGRIDVALEAGMRGSKNTDLASEKIFRFIISIGSGELWFMRPE